MAENKTKPTDVSVEEFIRSSDPAKVNDSFRLVEIMEKVSGEPAVMWGPSIIGFGSYHYKYDSGREGDMCRIGFSPRKSAFSLYILHCDDNNQENELLSKLGKYKLGAGACLYIKKLADVDESVLEQLIENSLEETRKKYD